MSDINELKFDKKNFNKHTEYGMGLLEKSLQKFGAGRSILVDKDNNIIAGNGIVEAATNAGITKTRVIETTGDELVVVKRKDVVLDSEKGREMALADNATAAADLEWDDELLKETFGEDIPGEWGVELGDSAVGSALLDEIKNSEYVEKESYFVKKPFVVIFYDEETKDKLGEKLGVEIDNDTYDARDL